MPKHPPNTLSLVADVGGTNTRVALADGARLLPETVRKYRNADYVGLETVLRTYIAEEDDVDCTAAAVAVAGPVRDGRGAASSRTSTGRSTARRWRVPPEPRGSRY